VGPIAAGFAAFAIGFISYISLTLDTETASAGSRAELSNPSVSATRSPFGEHFSFDQNGAPSSSLQPSHRSGSFDDRFGDVIGPSAIVSSAAAAPRATASRVAAGVPVPRPASRSAAGQATPKRSSEPRFRIASASDTSVSLAYAPTDPAKGSAMTGSALKDLKDSDPPANIDTSRTAIYDITSRTVFLPNGRRLEAHSGLGSHMDDPRHVHARGTGPTPPNVYDLKLCQAPFHGVRAIRLVPTDSSKMYGRDGILAHSYLLGPDGESNGCVSFKDYTAFLDAFERGEVNRLVVVERLTDPPSPKTAADWLANMLTDMFRRS
jgi:hypothetical protein